MPKRNEYMSAPIKTLLPMPDVKGCCGEPDIGKGLKPEDNEIGPAKTKTDRVLAQLGKPDTDTVTHLTETSDDSLSCLR